MRKNSRAFKIFEVGIAEYSKWSDPTDEKSAQLAALAAMIAHATTKTVKEKKKLLYTEHDVLKQLNYDLAVSRHGSLNRQLGTMTLAEGDLDQFKLWFSEVMYPWMHNKNIEFTYSMLVRKYPEWLEKARQHKALPSNVTTDGWR